MSSRENILGKVSKSKPSVLKSTIKVDAAADINLRDEFEISVKKVGGTLISMKSTGGWKSWIKTTFGTDINIYSEIEALEGNLKIAADINKNELNKIDVAVLEGEFGVSENGAVWVEKFASRAIPFITQHLVLVLKESNIIANLHEAYAELAEYGMPEFGVFIAGPSKTADIEQSLVHGAHGPKTLTVVLG